VRTKIKKVEKTRNVFTLMGFPSLKIYRRKWKRGYVEKKMVKND